MPHGGSWIIAQRSWATVNYFTHSNTPNGEKSLSRTVFRLLFALDAVLGGVGKRMVPHRDIARKDSDGYYWITGRTKTVINVGAIKVFPSELEGILLSDAAVKEAHVYAVKDGRFGEVPHLQYVNRSLSVFKAVRQIQIVAHLAETQTGKIKRYEPKGT